MCILGGAAQLGNWQLGEVLAMSPLTPATWEAEVRGCLFRRLCCWLARWLAG